MKKIVAYAMSVILVFSMVLGSITAFPGNQVQATLLGDATGDGELTVSDVVKVRNMILLNSFNSVGDLNGDGQLDDQDIGELREVIMNGGPSGATATEPQITNGVYQVSDTSEFLWIAENPDKDYALTSNINLTWQEGWTAIGTQEKPFSGSLDGNGHSVTVAISDNQEEQGIYEEGLFGYVTGDISNLTVDGTIDVKLYSGYVGAIVANLAGGSVVNCTNNAVITAESTNNVLHVGGIVGSARNKDNAAVLIDGAVNNGDIVVKAIASESSDTYLGSGTNGGAVGGILGFVSDGSGAEIRRSINNAKITVTGGKDNIGGILGQTSTNENATYANIIYCANKGDITVYETEGERAAGIIGYIKGGKIQYCYNVADVIEYTDADGNNVARMGYGNYYGIFGYANLYGDNELSVVYCYNASPNPLEAEICVVRNPDKGTFNNFYMSGRTEYETELNSNATAGTAGTEFSSASDLYSKLTATTEGASAYRSNGDGYPVLYFEQGGNEDPDDGVKEPLVVNGVYQISSVNEALWMAENPDKDYELIRDINLTSLERWTAIGTQEEPFSGSLDGNGHSVTVAISESREEQGIYEEGLFGYVTGDISNLTVNGTIDVKLYSGYVGAIAANLAGGSVVNCTNNAVITAESTNNVIHVGGIVGAARNVDNSVSMIDGAVNYGDINVKAVTTGSSDINLGDGTSGGAVGGILGFVVTASGVDVGRSINNGKITVRGGKDNIGGIIGQTSTNGTSSTAYANITYCANKGAITVYETEGERAAGIIGYVKGGRIEYCYNIADVIAYTDAEGNNVARIGYGNYYGIFGYANLYSSNKLSVIYCYNASPNPLEAEICVIRNAGYGTFNNFYMSGRTEYETELNSNATAGTAGTEFSSASDLYSKLTATTEGASAYRSNGDGYPVLYFEQGSDTSGSVSIALTDMPNYIDGTAGANVYDCGPGMMSDENGATGQESKMVVVKSTNATSFERYAAKLMNGGFQKEAKAVVENNIYYTFTKNNKIYQIYYTANKNEARFIEDISSNTLLKDLSTQKTGNNGTELYMYSIDYSEHEHTYSTTDHWCIDCGMMYIIKLADNSVFLIDSGHERQSSKEAMTGLLDFLRNITGTSESEKVKIRGWFFSHAHGDHVFGAHQFVETYHDNIDIESVLFNFPRYGVVGGYDGGTFKMKNTINKYFPNVKHVSLHTGQSFTMQGVKFDTLCTHEDWVGTDGKTTLGGDMNTASTVLKITIDGKSLMLLGDITMSNRLEEMYTTTTLKSDMVQIAHHGYNSLESLYKKIAAPYAVCPNSEENGQDNANKIQKVIDAGAKNLYYSDEYTYKFVATADGFDVSTLDRYTVALGIDFEAPAFNANDVSGQNASIADLNAMTSRTSVLDKLITKSVLGSPATNTNGNELPYQVFDGKTDTKWCTKSSEQQQFYIKWKMTEPVTINGYALYTGNDTEASPSRNPVKWVLKGSNDGKNWNIIDAVSNGNLPAKNYEGTAFNVKNPGKYQYYVIQFLGVNAYETAKNAYLLQLSEIKLYQ